VKLEIFVEIELNWALQFNRGLNSTLQNLTTEVVEELTNLIGKIRVGVTGHPDYVVLVILYISA
jgi:hypothetical protein